MRARLRAAAICGALILSGCGIKGPLYLPEIPSAPKGPSAGAVDHNKAPSAPNEAR